MKCASPAPNNSLKPTRLVGEDAIQVGLPSGRRENGSSDAIAAERLISRPLGS